MAKPLVLDLHIPYCIRPENYLAHFNAVGSNAEKNAYMDALKRVFIVLFSFYIMFLYLYLSYRYLRQ